MKRLAFALAAMLGLAVASGANAAIVLTFSSIANSQIEFTGNGSTTSFHLTPSLTGLVIPGGPNGIGKDRMFSITSVQNGIGDALGLFGDVTGTFSYSASDITSPGGGVERATLTSVGGPAQLTLGPDTGNVSLTATIDWIDIETKGTGSALNAQGQVNISSVSYSGTNADLIMFANQVAAQGGIGTLSFSFLPTRSLNDLLGPGTFKTGYSGSLTAAPEPGTVAMALTALPLLGLGYCRHRRRVRS